MRPYGEGEGRGRQYLLKLMARKVMAQVEQTLKALGRGEENSPGYGLGTLQFEVNSQPFCHQRPGLAPISLSSIDKYSSSVVTADLASPRMARVRSLLTIQIA